MRFAPTALTVLALSLAAAPAARPQSQPITMDDPDGKIFVSAPGGGARHAATGFVCPASLGGLPRRGLYIFDTSDHGRDVGCGYGAPGSALWYTLYLAKLEITDSKKVFENEVREEQKAAAPKGEAKSPLAPGLPPLPQRASFWTAQDDKVDGIFFASIGAWHVNLHATFDTGHEADVSAAAKTVFSQAFDQVKGPEV